MILDIYNSFNKLFKELKEQIDFNLDFSLSNNVGMARFYLTNFYSKIVLCYYAPKDVSFYVNETVENIDDFKKIETEKDFLKFLHKLNKD